MIQWLAIQASNLRCEIVSQEGQPKIVLKLYCEASVKNNVRRHKRPNVVILECFICRWEGGEVGRWKRWEGNEVGRCERWEGSEGGKVGG